MNTQCNRKKPKNQKLVSNIRSDFMREKQRQFIEELIRTSVGAQTQFQSQEASISSSARSSLSQSACVLFKPRGYRRCLKFGQCSPVIHVRAQAAQPKSPPPTQFESPPSQRASKASSNSAPTQLNSASKSSSSSSAIAEGFEALHWSSIWFGS